MNEKTTRHLMKLFDLSVNKGYTIQDCEKVIARPILLFDSVLEVWEDVKIFPYINGEKLHFRELEKAIRLFNSEVFFTLTMEEKLELADEMSDFTDYIKRNLFFLEQGFHRGLMNKYESTEIRNIIVKLYLVSVLCQCILLYFQHLKKTGSTLLMDFLKTAIYRTQRLYSLLDKRGDMTESLYDPNADGNIATSVKAFVNAIFNYKEEK